MTKLHLNDVNSLVLTISLNSGAGISTKEHPLDSSFVLIFPDLPDGADTDQTTDDEETAADEEGGVEWGLVEADLSIISTHIHQLGQSLGVKSQVWGRHYLKAFDHVNSFFVSEHISNLHTVSCVTTLPSTEEMSKSVCVRLESSSKLLSSVPRIEWLLRR